jgi:hypothetical protein
MTAIKRATKIIESLPHGLQASQLAEVVRALESGTPLPLSKFNHTDLRFLRLLLDLVEEWQMDRHEKQRKHLLTLVQNFEDYRSNNDFT